MNVMELEQAARCAWPAVEEEELSFGVLRYARGTERRVNSLSVYSDADIDSRELIAVTEKFFDERDAAPTVRIVSADSNSLALFGDVDSALEERGYEKQSPTLSMLLDLGSDPALASSNIDVPENSVDLVTWLDSWYGLTGKSMLGRDVHESLLRRSIPAQLFLLHRASSGAPLSTGMAVFSGQAVGLFGVATSSAHRSRGHASAILDSLLRWGRARGARYAYLQVEESNEAALSLYKKLGFKKHYSYWYRVGIQKTRIGKGRKR